jgi:hypothetical protein
MEACIVSSDSYHLPSRRPCHTADQRPAELKDQRIRNSKNHLLSGLKPPASRQFRTREVAPTSTVPLSKNGVSSTLILVISHPSDPSLNRSKTRRTQDKRNKKLKEPSSLRLEATRKQAIPYPGGCVNKHGTSIKE